MKTLLSLLALALLASPAVSAAQTADPVSHGLRQIEMRASHNIIAAAEEMPASKYSYRPTAGQMSYAQLMLHITGANGFMCSVIGGKPMPARSKLTPSSPKAQIVTALKASFAYCSQALAGLKDAQLGDPVPFFGGRKVPRAMMVLEAAGDWADHYGQAAGMLRLNGMLPPTAQHKKM